MSVCAWRFFPAALAAIAALAAGRPAVARAQSPPSTFGQPRTPFNVNDFAKLRWLEGTWEGTSPGEHTFYERAHFVNDSTVALTYYDDPQLSHQTGEGRVYLTVGRVYHTFGPNRWGATHLDGSNVHFIPQVVAHNSFDWVVHSPDSWTATIRDAVAGREHVIVYEMKRIGR
jgi:hypothetical protein